jgi:hypothetical protein
MDACLGGAEQLFEAQGEGKQAQEGQRKSQRR